jgi:hypothetical protein
MQYSLTLVLVTFFWCLKEHGMKQVSERLIYNVGKARTVKLISDN